MRNIEVTPRILMEILPAPCSDIKLQPRHARHEVPVTFQPPSSSFSVVTVSVTSGRLANALGYGRADPIRFEHGTCGRGEV